MPSKVVLDAVRERQAANWTSTAVFYPNDAVSPAADLAAFVQVEFLVGSGLRRTLELNGLHVELGTFRFVVHCRIKTGPDLAFTYADELAALFTSVELKKTTTEFLETDAPTPPSGAGADVAYYLVSTSVPYRYLFRL
jgi:hypothetical protein